MKEPLTPEALETLISNTLDGYSMEEIRGLITCYDIGRLPDYLVRYLVRRMAREENSSIKITMTEPPPAKCLHWSVTDNTAGRFCNHCGKNLGVSW